MANPIKSSDILQDDGAITLLIEQLKALEKQGVKSIEALKKEAELLQAALKKTNTTTTKGKRATEEAADKTDEIARRMKKYKESLSETGQEIAALKLAQQQLNRVNKLSAKEAIAAAGSYDEVSAKLSILKIRFKQMSEEEREATKEGKALTKEINELNDKLKKVDKTVGVHTRNVGNYKAAILEAKGASSSFNGVLNLIRKNPVLGVFSAILGVVGLLGSAFLKTEKGVNIMNKAAAFSSALFSELIDLSLKVADKISAAFSDPVGALKDFGKLLLTQLINRVVGAIELVTALGKTIGNTLVLDFEAAEKAAKEAGTAIAKITTGLDEEQLEKVSESFKDISENIDKTAQEFDNLFKKQKRVISANRSLTRTIEKLTTQEALLSQIAGDSTLGFEEQRKAATELEKVLIKKGETEIKLAKNNLSIINQELALRRNDEKERQRLLDEQLGAIQALEQAERSLTVSKLENATERRQINRDEFERELDFAIDVADAQLMQNERVLKDDRTTFKQRVKLLEENRAINDSAFSEQIKLIEDFTGKKLSLDELAAESDEKVIRQRLRGHQLDDVVLGRVLELIRERKATTQDLADIEGDLFKQRNKQNGSAPNLLPAFDFDGKAKQESIQNITKGAEDVLAKAKDEIKNAENTGTKDIFDLLGFNFSDERKQGVTSALEFAKNQLLEFASFRTQIAQQNVEAANTEVAAAQRALQAEISNRNAGFANRVETTQKELELAEKNQKKALEAKQKAQRQEQRLQSIQQAVNLITASSKIFQQIGNPLIAIPLIALMFGAFAAAKIKSSKLTKQQFGKGTYQDIDWGASHDSGNDIPIGLSKDGKQMMTVEKGESMAVFNKKAKKQYGNRTLKNVVDLINKGQFDTWSNSDEMLGGIALNFHQNQNSDNSKMENSLEGIRRNTERKIFQNGNQTIEIYKNRKTIYS